MRTALRRTARRSVDRALSPHLDRHTTDCAGMLGERLAVPQPDPVVGVELYMPRPEGSGDVS